MLHQNKVDNLLAEMYYRTCELPTYTTQALNRDFFLQTVNLFHGSLSETNYSQST